MLDGDLETKVNKPLFPLGTHIYIYTYMYVHTHAAALDAGTRVLETK